MCPESSIMKPSSERAREIFRFVQVGVASNVAYFSTLALAHLLFGITLWLGAALAYAISMLVNYRLHHRHTFRSTERHSQALFKYLILQTGMLSTNSIVLHLMVTQARGSYIVAQILAIVLVTCLTYFLGRHWVFFRKKSDNQKPSFQTRR